MKRKRIFTVILIAALFMGIMSPAIPMLKSNVEYSSAKIKKFTLLKGYQKKLYIRNTTKRVTWKSYNKRIATVTKYGGVVKGIRVGTAKIRAKYGKRKLYVRIVVKKKKTSKSNSGSGNGTVATKTPVPIVTPIPTQSPEDVIGSKISVSATRLASGKILFTVKNSSSYLIYHAQIDIARYTPTGQTLSETCVFVNNLQAYGTQYCVESPDSDGEKMDPGKIQIIRKDITYNSVCTSMSKNVSATLASNPDMGTAWLLATFKNNSVKTLHLYFIVLYRDSSGNVVDAVHSSFTNFYPGDTNTVDVFKASNDYSGTLLNYSKATLYWWASEIV